MEALRQQLRQLWLKLAVLREQNPALFNLGAALALVGLLLGAMLYLLDPGAPRVLAANLAPADRTALALRLRRHHLPFSLSEDAISVPERYFEQARAVLEGSPGFSGGGYDFGLFDHASFGQSDFEAQVNYQRSVQGELERTIMDIRGVDSARVMIAMEHPSPFALGPGEAGHASVLLTTAPGAQIDASVAAAIAHLVAGAVRGLKPELVIVTTSDGATLFPPPNRNDLSQATELRNDLEHRLQGKVARLLTRVMGENRYAAAVSVALDTSRISRQESIYGSGGDRVILSEEHSVAPVEPPAAGIPGLTSNLPTATPSPTPAPVQAAGAAPPAAAGAVVQKTMQSGELARKDIINYQPSKREVRNVGASIRIERISVAVVLDGTYEGGRFKPLEPERLAAIKHLITAAVGAQPQRGDTVDVQSAPLSQPYIPPVPNPVTQLRSLLSNPLYLYGAVGLGALLAVALAALLTWRVRRWLARRKTRTQARAHTLLEQVQQQVAAENGAGADRAEPDFAELQRRLNEHVERNPAAAAAVLRSWISGGRSAPNPPEHRISP
jgi:flagellar M-ring protein FliF